MLIRQSRARLITLSTTFVAVTFTAIMASGQTTAQTSTRGTPEVTTRKLSGTVVQVDGNQLLVKLTSGEVRMFTPPADSKFTIDGKDMRLSELQPGTKLNATYTETSTPVTDRTVQTITGKVWYVAAPNVILTLPSGENRQFVVKNTVKFRHSDGRDMTVFDLRQGMNVTAEKITEAPRVELVTTRAVTGTVPAVASTASKPDIAPAATTGATPRAAVPAVEPPASLPKTASPLPLVGLLGLLRTGGAFGIRRYRRQ
jgi:hypothetical protein